MSLPRFGFVFQSRSDEVSNEWTPGTGTGRGLDLVRWDEARPGKSYIYSNERSLVLLSGVSIQGSSTELINY